jgi:hypothetical protein
MTTKAEDLARAALQGFFDDPQGFDDMGSSQRQKAVKAVERALDQVLRDHEAHVATSASPLWENLR